MDTSPLDQAAEMRKTAKRIRSMASYILLLCSVILTSGGYVFFQAGNIVATDQNDIIKQQTEHLRAMQVSLLKEFEESRAMQIKLLQESEIELERLKAIRESLSKESSNSKPQ